VYFSLKDPQAQVRCAFFRQHQRLVGIALRTVACAPACAREPVRGSGDFQIIVNISKKRRRRLAARFDALKQRLAKEGLFETGAQLPLPRLPRRIGIITSLPARCCTIS